MFRNQHRFCAASCPSYWKHWVSQWRSGHLPCSRTSNYHQGEGGATSGPRETETLGSFGAFRCVRLSVGHAHTGCRLLLPPPFLRRRPPPPPLRRLRTETEVKRARSRAKTRAPLLPHLPPPPIRNRTSRSTMTTTTTTTSSMPCFSSFPPSRTISRSFPTVC